MVNITINLDIRRVKKDGTYPIVFRIYHQQRSFTRSTKICVLEKHWDDSKKLIKSASLYNSVKVTPRFWVKLAA
ncbi:Arm DNA-binding domain-containing protein [Pedobacter duraquae]|uniref:Integrase-like protein n=1 Tax=Pedobacter duraquae TaxID=425511 RepID=A0A4R6IH91_9SPHI|nr:Arm DNA-binding domain-containing protein [Pedobacter duraquae]TDO21326.1 integrase-like protein [Pedobacter duraquae]